LRADRPAALTAAQLEMLGTILHAGAIKASSALARWIQKPAIISVDSVAQIPLAEATGILGDNDEPICFCASQLTGRLTGQLILAFDKASGLTLADLLMDQTPGTASEWDEMATSAALETANIVGCTYLNVLSKSLDDSTDDQSAEILPSSFRFSSDYAESLIQFALIGQITDSPGVLMASAQFRIDGAPVDWTLLLVPDAESMTTLCEILE
jgi:chemotaxis protein CheC